MTDPSLLPLPGWLSEDVRARPASVVLDQSVDVNRRWWADSLGGGPFADELFEAPDSRLTRAHLFDLGSRAGDSAQDARRLLWATLAWGTGRRHRHNRLRLAAVTDGGDVLGEVLRRAAATGRTDPRTAYRELRPYRNAVSHLGPPFFTKFLYFAGGGGPTHPCLILDSMVAKSLRRDCGWTTLTGFYSWSAPEYIAYCELLARWASELDEPRSDQVTRPDQLEYSLFLRGKRP